MEIRAYNDMSQFKTCVIFFDDRGDKVFYYSLFGRDPKVHVRQSSDCSPLPDEFIMRVPLDIYSRLVKAMGEFAEAEGHKPDSVHKLEGTLEATRYHLEDLRRLLELNKDRGNGKS